jgi:hypothetical protein
MLHEGVVDQKIYFSRAFDRDGEYIQVPRVYTEVLDPREGQCTCVYRGMNRVEPGRNTSSQERIRQWIYAGMREESMRKLCGSGACNTGVRQGPGVQEAKPLCSCHGLIRLGPNSYRHRPRAIAPDQCSHHPLEPCSYRPRSSTETNTGPLVVVCSARVRCVVHNTEGLH